MKRWELPETHALVKAAFGAAQLQLARESIRSLVDRENYASYHFRETNRLTKDFERRHLKDGHLLEIYTHAGKPKRVAFEQYIIKASAHAVASVQSIHALPDILANAVYLASGQNLLPNAVPENEIAMPVVIRALKANTNFCSLVPLLTKAQSGSHWQHLAALTNLSKHRSVVRTNLNEDLTGLRKKHRELHFQAFERNTKHFPAISVQALLEPEFTRLATLIVEVGHGLNACLRKIAA
jgi:hypothetical protein